jgi:group II intron reverse transcriptase/maturase
MQLAVSDDALKAIRRIETLQELNSNKEWTNKDLYRLMLREDLYIIAYEKIKSKPGNMTPGTDNNTLDGTSLERIRKIVSEMKECTYQFQPTRTVYIPKENGKQRKLGIPSTRDKIVQEVMRMVLEAIYDSPKGPLFSNDSHGFRRERSTHTALKEIRMKWDATNWIVEGDIKSCFDEIDHQKMIEIIRRKIKDERFIDLIWKLLRAGEFDVGNQKEYSLAGTPQGGIVSPILANIYLNELDEYIVELKKEIEKGDSRGRNAQYRALAQKRSRLVKEGKIRSEEFERLTKEMRNLPSVNVEDPGYIRIRYTRYADDWIVGVCGSKNTADIVKDKIGKFLKEKLNLRLSEEKTRITNAKTEEASFLGYQIRIGRTSGPPKKSTSTNSSGINFKRRSTGWEVVLKAPLDKIIIRLSRRGFCKLNGEPTPMMKWQELEVAQIISLYSSVNRGILGYYRPADNYGALTRVQYILEYSLAKTIAMKMRKRLPGVLKNGLEATVNGKKVSFYKNQDWKVSRGAFKTGDPNADIVKTSIKLRTRSKLGQNCCICGSESNLEMHHVKHIRRMDKAGKEIGFARVLHAINRKQIPVCESCHDKIHAGKYDDLRLSDLEYNPAKSRQ